MSKIYVSNLDSPLGYHIVDLLRTDHQHPENHSLIIGSSADPVYSPIHQAINFSTHPQLACRAILDCQLVILDLTNESHEAQIIIKFLQKSYGNLRKPLKVIGLSSLLTWEGTRGFQLQKQGDREKMISSIIDPISWKRVSLLDKDYPKRISSCFATKNYQLENMLIKLNKITNINATILAYGLLYGRDNGKIQNCILNGLSRQAQICYGVGDNLLTTTHIESLLNSIQLLWKQQKIDYVICCDKEKVTQRELKQTINEITYNVTETIIKEPLYITKEDSEWSMNISFQPSTILSSLCGNSFKEYAKSKLMQEFCDYTCFRPAQSFADIDLFSQNQVIQLKQLLKCNCALVLQEDINRIDQQMIAKLTPPEPQSNKRTRNQSLTKPPVQQQIERPHFYRQALETLLKNRRYSNFVLIVQKAMLPYLSSEYFYDQLKEIVPQSIARQYDLQPTQIQFKSQRFNQLYGISSQRQQTIVEDNTPLRAANIRQEQYVPQKTVKKDQQLILLNQYLTDNVLLYISEAKFTLKAKKLQATLHNLIAELKQLLTRTQTRASNRIDS